MSCQFKLVHRVEFCETDMAGIVHFSNFFRYMELAESAFFRSLGFSIVTWEVEPPLGWPRVHASCDYKQPLRFEDEVEIQLFVTRKKSKAITYTFLFRKLNASPPVLAARGAVTVVCVKRQNGRMKATTIPNVIANKISVAPPAILRQLRHPL